jgi:circadian clock protein KaiC
LRHECVRRAVAPQVGIGRSAGGKQRLKKTETARVTLPKSATGIRGLDEITEGGLPTGRPTLVCGGPGCGKTLLAAEFLVRGAVDYGEPGVFMAFEETAADLAANVASLGFDLNELIADKKIYVDHVRVQRSEIEESGEYDLEGLFVRLAHAVEKVGAKRVVLDTIETLFSSFTNEAVLRAELRRLFRWLKDRGLTAVITGERGNAGLTRQGLEEYVSDCVIFLDHRVDGQVSTRRLRVVKYRGSTHGTNEYPFLIDEGGFSVFPVTTASLTYDVQDARVSSGIPDLDDMLGGDGYYRGASVLVSGTAGTGKTLVCSNFVNAACERGERALFFAFEEAPSQIIRNTRTVGLDLARHLQSGLLRFHSARPTLYGVETHLARIRKEVDHFDPQVVVLDPITALIGGASATEVNALTVRLLDSFKEAGITALFSTLTSSSDSALEATEIGISSLVDTWLLLRDIELNGERNRGIYVLKSRGMAHSNQIREFLITKDGVRLLSAYLGPEGVLTGSSRLQQESKQRAAEADRKDALERRRLRFEQRRAAIEAQMAALQAELDAERAELDSHVGSDALRLSRMRAEELELARSRHVAARQQVPVSSDGYEQFPQDITLK